MSKEQNETKENRELPPRSETHSKKEKQRIKIKYPLVRLMLLCFLLVPITFFLYTYYQLPQAQNEKKGYEKVKIEVKKNNAEGIIKDTEDKEETTPSTTPKKESDAVESPAPQQEKYTVHTVQQGETLYSISMKYYKTREGEPFIRTINNLISNELTAGQILKIPAKEVIGLK